MTMMHMWLHKADPTYSRARPKNCLACWPMVSWGESHKGMWERALNISELFTPIVEANSRTTARPLHKGRLFLGQAQVPVFSFTTYGNVTFPTGSTCSYGSYDPGPGTYKKKLCVSICSSRMAIGPLHLRSFQFPWNLCLSVFFSPPKHFPETSCSWDFFDSTK